jgi:hypothetical protein
VTATTAVRVVTETRQGWLTMSDLRVFTECWFAMSEYTNQDTTAAGAVEPVVMIEGQAGRISKISADLPIVPPPS